MADGVVADAIVVAAGGSTRMGGIDKLAVLVAGRPLLAHAVLSLASAPEVGRIVIVTAPERLAALAAAEWLPPSVVAVVAGGDRRQVSVERGLDALEGLDAATGGGSPDSPGAAGSGSRSSATRGVGSGTAASGTGTGPVASSSARVVLVHDGARPLATTSLVSAVARAAAEHGAAIPVVPVGDTIKRLEPDGRVSGAGDRSALAAAQTPQGVRADLLRRAFERFPAAGPETFTDEAALLEACRIPVHAIPGEPSNLKVTLPADIATVEQALGRGRVPGTSTGPAGDAVRVGLGTDSHPFGPGSGLALGGLVIDDAPRLHGHSDGDVVLHAVADGLLGAAGLGDLGRLFPAGPATPRGIASSELLDEVAQRVAAAGLAIQSVDCTIIAARPRLAARLPEIATRLAALLGIDPAAVNVKASTGNLDGMEGAGRGISAQAVVVLEPRVSVAAGADRSAR